MLYFKPILERKKTVVSKTKVSGSTHVASMPKPDSHLALTKATAHYILAIININVRII